MQAEGLTLVPSDNVTGFKGVSHIGRRFRAHVGSGGARSYLGTFDTALGWALAIGPRLMRYGEAMLNAQMLVVRRPPYIPSVLDFQYFIVSIQYANAYTVVCCRSFCLVQYLVQ